VLSGPFPLIHLCPLDCLCVSKADSCRVALDLHPRGYTDGRGGHRIVLVALRLPRYGQILVPGREGRGGGVSLPARNTHSVDSQAPVARLWSSVSRVQEEMWVVAYPGDVGG